MMTPEEMDQRIGFILQMQAQFEVNVGKLETNLARCVTTIDNLRVSVVDLAEVVRESIRLSDDRFTRLDERMADLAEAQKASDERLNALINVVEKHITGPDHAARP
jgi:FtsZ-binding cell division protein ZapB